MSLLSGTPFSSVSGTIQNTYPVNTNSGVQYNNNWYHGTYSNAITANIAVPGLVPGTPVQITTQLANYAQSNVNDGANCWVIAGISLSDNITAVVANGGSGSNGQPSDNANYGLSWIVNY
jgi:hypothetical protein